jgi:hypothetical protein
MENEKIDHVAGLVRLLTNRPGAGWMVLIHGPAGFECVATCDDPVFQFGLMKVCKETLEMRFRDTLKVSLKTGETAQREAEIAAHLDTEPKGGVN